MIEALRGGKALRGSSTTTAERLVVVKSAFTRKERQRLEDDGAVPYLLVAETMSIQRKAGRRFFSTWHEGKQLETVVSRVMEVAIYPAPERFFVPDTFDKPMAEQDRLMKQHAKDLRERLGLPGIDEGFPKISEATQVLFKHLDATGVYLLGEDYLDPTETRSWRYMRTKTRTNRSGSLVAYVGGFVAGDGPTIHDFPAARQSSDIGAACWVVKR